MKLLVSLALFNLYKDLFLSLREHYEALPDTLRHNKKNIGLNPLNAQ